MKLLEADSAWVVAICLPNTSDERGDSDGVARIDREDCGDAEESAEEDVRKPFSPRSLCHCS